jgi:hypothetical protein
MPLTLSFITAKYSDNKEKAVEAERNSEQTLKCQETRVSFFYTFQETGVMSDIMPSFLLREKLPQLTYFALV